MCPRGRSHARSLAHARGSQDDTPGMLITILMLMAYVVVEEASYSYRSHGGITLR